jgi:lysophospholipase L1-like esterase
MSNGLFAEYSPDGNQLGNKDSTVAVSKGKIFPTNGGSLLSSGWRSAALTKLATAFPSYNKSTSLSALDYCCSQKQEVEAGFTSVKFIRLNRGTQALNSTKVVAFSTETMAYDTSVNMAFPVVGGTTYAALAASNDIKGFFAVTWGGADNISTASTTATSGPTVAISDMCYVTDVPRKTGEASTRPILGWRAEHLGSVNGNWGFPTVNANVRDPLGSMRGRTLVTSRYAAAGAIADLTTAKPFTLDTLIHDVYPEVYYKVPVFSVWGVGDSITACTGITTDGQSAWGHKACTDLSTPARPVIWANLGSAGQNSDDFWVNCKSLLAAGVTPPSMLIVNVASINDYGSTPDVRKAAKTTAIAAEAVKICQQYNIPHLVIWGTGPSANIATAPLDAVRKTQNTTLSVFAQQANIYWLDISDLGNGASPEDWVAAFKFDALHPNEVGQDYSFVPKVRAIIARAAGL